MSKTKLAYVTLLLVLTSSIVPAQSSTPSPSVGQTVGGARTTADESFELNIDQRRITSEDFEASTAIETDPNAQGLNLQIGVALAASHINVLLVNVRGRVRFRGSLERILDMLDTRRNK